MKRVGVRRAMKKDAAPIRPMKTLPVPPDVQVLGGHEFLRAFVTADGRLNMTIADAVLGVDESDQTLTSMQAWGRMLGAVINDLAIMHIEENGGTFQDAVQALMETLVGTLSDEENDKIGDNKS